MAEVLTHMCMSLDGFVARTDDKPADLFDLPGGALVRTREGGEVLARVEHDRPIYGCVGRARSTDSLPHRRRVVGHRRGRRLGGRRDDLELNVLVQAVVVTEDREKAASELAPRFGLKVENALATPFLALGTYDEIAEHLLACRERWGISYFSVHDIASFAPVIERLRAPTTDLECLVKDAASNHPPNDAPPREVIAPRPRVAGAYASRRVRIGGTRPIGPKLAEGRDSEIFEHGPGRVLRLARDGRSLEREAAVMRYVRERGFPAPAVDEAGQGYLVMERLEGPTMLEAALTHPARLGEYGRMLADLHNRLHNLEAPPGLPEASLAGERLLHRDLHPLNVLMTAGGPVVIDWANAARGDPAYDVADTWVLFATADVPGGLKDRALAAVGRRVFLRHFLGSLDTRSAQRAIPVVVRDRSTDRHMTQAEKARMRRMADRASRRQARELAG